MQEGYLYPIRGRTNITFRRGTDRGPFQKKVEKDIENTLNLEYIRSAKNDGEMIDHFFIQFICK